MPDVKLRYIVTDEGTIRVLDQAGKELGELERKAVSAGETSSRSLNKVGTSLEKVGALANRAAAGLAVMGTAATAAVAGQLQVVDQITKTARAAGVAVDELSSLRTASDLSGTSITELGQGLGILNRRLLETTSGVGRSQNVFRALGVEVRDQNGLLRENTEVLKDVATVFAQLPDGPQKTAAAMELFGRSGAKFINLLDQGRVGIEALQKENDRLGLTFDETFGTKAEAVNDNINRLTLAGAGLATVFASAVTPTLVQASEGLLQFLGIVDSARPTGRAAELIETQNRLRTDQAFAQEYLNRGNTGGLIQPTPENRLAAIAALDTEIRETREAEREVTGAILGVRESLGLDQDKVVTDVEGLLKKLQAAMREGGDAAEKAAPKVDKLKESYRKLPDPIRAANAELEQTSETISISLGDAFRRLTTSGGEYGILDGLSNAFQAAGADMFDAILGEKLKFDIEVERNFIQDIPGFAQQGWDAIKSIWSSGTEDLAAQTDRLGGRIASSLGRGFTAVAQGGQSLVGALSGLFGSDPAGGGFTPQYGQSQQGPGDQLVNIPGIGLVTQSDLDKVNQVGDAEKKQQQQSGQLQHLYTLLAIGSIRGIIAGQQFFDDNRGNLAIRGQREFDRGANDAALTAFFETVLGGYGLGDLAEPAANFIGDIAGPHASPDTALLDGILGFPLFGLTGIDLGIFNAPSRGDQVGKYLNDEIFKKNPLLLQQGVFRDSGRTGIDADKLFFTPNYRIDRLEELGLPFREAISPGSRLAAAFASNANYELEESLFTPTFGLASLLGRGDADDTSLFLNTLLNNQLLLGQEFEEEGLRQIRQVARQAGFTLPTAIESLASDFNRAQQDFEVGGNQSELNREQFIERAAAVIDLLGEDLPAGVDVLRLVEENTGKTSVNVGGILEGVERQVQLYGQLESTLSSGLRSGISAEFASILPSTIVASGGTVSDAIRAASRQGSGFVSSIQTSALTGVQDLLAGQLFDQISEGLLQAVGEAAGAGQFNEIPGLIADYIGKNLPEIQATQQAFSEAQEILRVTPDSLFAQSDSFRQFSEQSKFNELSPDQKRADLLRRINNTRERIFGYYTDDRDDASQAPLIQAAFTELGNLGQDLYTLGGSINFGSGVAGDRARTTYLNEARGYVDFAATGLNNLGQDQMDLLTQSNNDLIDTIGELIEVVKSGNIAPDVIAQAIARLLVNDPVSRDALEQGIVTEGR